MPEPDNSTCYIQLETFFLSSPIRFLFRRKVQVKQIRKITKLVSAFI